MTPTTTTSGTSPTARPFPTTQALTVFTHELRQLLLGPRTLWSMAAYTGLSVLVLSLIGLVRSQVVKAAGPLADKLTTDYAEQTAKVLGEVLEFTGWGDIGVATEILRDGVPLVVVVFFIGASYGLPLLVAFVAHDQFSELSTRGARWVLLRVPRTAYFAGKTAANAVAVWGFLATTWVLVVFRSLASGDAVGTTLAECVRAWLCMCVLALPYLALTALVSTFVGPAAAFVATFATWIGLLVGAIGVRYWLPKLFTDNGLESLVDPSQRLLALFPWHHAGGLISRHGPDVLRSIVGLVVLAALAYALALWNVRRRDA